jgi:hypothetical protein
VLIVIRLLTYLFVRAGLSFDLDKYISGYRIPQAPSKKIDKKINTKSLTNSQNGWTSWPNGHICRLGTA